MAFIDLPDHGYVSAAVQAVEAGSVLPGTLGGPTESIDRLGYRYAVTFQTRELPSSYEAREFEALLERASGAVLPRLDASYPWPMDIAADPLELGATPTVDGASPAGAVIPITGLASGYRFRDGQPIAVISGGVGFIHRSNGVNVADGSGEIVLPVYPLTRQSFANGDTVEILKPRIRGILTWESSQQGAYGRRGFRFTITERR